MGYLRLELGAESGKYVNDVGIKLWNNEMCVPELWQQPLVEIAPARL